MIVAGDAGSMRSALTGAPRPLGFVPTMGALHAGHLSLVREAAKSCATVVASTFVNPMQFGAGEDFDRYPRDERGDRTKLADCGVFALFAPTPATMYPPGFSTIVDVGDLATTFEGAQRPTHFRGVTTVVTKLLHVVAPDTVYLGQKDAQQAAVLRKLVRDLDFPVKVRTVPTFREEDGLAMSSRNVYLTREARTAAPSFHAALERMLRELRAGCDAVQARERAKPVLRAPGTWEYLDLVDPDTFAPLETLRPPACVIGAVRFDGTRLIDNLLVAS